MLYTVPFRAESPALPPPSFSSSDPVPAQQRRGFWLRTLHQWHWISSAVCLLGMLLFAITGITLNNAGSIESKPVVATREGTLPDDLRAALQPKAEEGDRRQAPLPAALSAWLDAQFKIRSAGRDAEWSRDEVYLSMPRPGGDAWVRIDRDSGEAEYESTDRGWVSYLNDLHKGRHAGTVWSWFLDVFSVAALIFSITGLFILKLHATNRPGTWPIVGLGVVIPLLLAMLFVHG